MYDVTLTPDPKVLRKLYDVPAVDFARNLRTARATGRSYTALITDVLKLQTGPGRLSPQEYFYYRLWDRELSLERKQQFIGRDRQRYFYGICNDERVRPIADDKLVFHEAMTAARVPVPDLVAVVHASRRSPGVPCLTNAAEICDLLASPSAYPVFGKPIDGVFSLGVFRVDGREASTDELIFHDGTRAAVQGCAEQLASYAPGYLLQRVLQPHPEIAQRFGGRLWSIRLLILLRPSGPMVSRAVCKIATGSNLADNFWRAGNMVGAVDLPTGTIARTVRGAGADMQVDVPHPDSGEPIVGFAVPDWSNVVEAGLRAATTLPEIRTQSWDIAVTDRGPVILEVNYGGDLNLAQLAWGSGLLDDAYRAHLAECGVKG